MNAIDIDDASTSMVYCFRRWLENNLGDLTSRQECYTYIPETTSRYWFIDSLYRGACNEVWEHYAFVDHISYMGGPGWEMFWLHAFVGNERTRRVVVCLEDDLLAVQFKLEYC